MANPDDPRDIDERELQQRVVYALARPLAQLSEAFRMPLADLVGHVRLAYFHHLKQRGLKLREIGERIGVSERQAKRLQKDLRRNFLDSERHYDLPVRIEFMLWATPMSRAKLKQVMAGASGKDIERAVEQLLAEDRIVETSGRTPTLKANRAVNSLVRDTWLARLGGLTSLLSNLSDAVYGRFFRAETKSFARTLTFLVRPDDVPELERHFAESLVPLAQRLDERSKEAGDGEPIRLSIAWAPYDYLTSRLDADAAASTDDDSDGDS